MSCNYSIKAEEEEGMDVGMFNTDNCLLVTPSDN